ARRFNGLLHHGELLGFVWLIGHISFLSRGDEYALHTKILTGSWLLVGKKWLPATRTRKTNNAKCRPTGNPPEK
ncbi:MAG: hypothetical protein ACYC2J_15080, partial [Acidithiobacillus ferrooxidans]